MSYRRKRYNGSIDADKKKQGSSIRIGIYEYDVKDPSELCKISKDVIILITNSIKLVELYKKEPADCSAGSFLYQ